VKNQKLPYIHRKKAAKKRWLVFKGKRLFIIKLIPSHLACILYRSERTLTGISIFILTDEETES